MSINEQEEDSHYNLNIEEIEEDYLRQVRDIEEQRYIDTQVPLADDESSAGLKKELNIEGGKIAKKSLIFDLKNVSVFRLYFHLSEPFEYFLMIVGFIGSIATGASNPIMAYLTGSTTSDASESASDKLEELDEEEKQIFFAAFKKTMDKKVREFMIYGAASFLAAFISNFFLGICFIETNASSKRKIFCKNFNARTRLVRSK